MAQRGTIQRLVSDRGFGFIRPDGDKKGRDLFFHMSGLQNVEFEALKHGDKVEFETELVEKGPRAIDIRVV